MKYFRILPAAASIIALSATIAFAGDMKEIKEADSFRIRVEMKDATDRANEVGVHSLPAVVKTAPSHTYRVEIERGNQTKVVSIDAYTGRILGTT